MRRASLVKLDVPPLEFWLCLWCKAVVPRGGRREEGGCHGVVKEAGWRRLVSWRASGKAGRLVVCTGQRDTAAPIHHHPSNTCCPACADQHRHTAMYLPGTHRLPPPAWHQMPAGMASMLRRLPGLNFSSHPWCVPRLPQQACSQRAGWIVAGSALSRWGSERRCRDLPLIAAQQRFACPAVQQHGGAQAGEQPIASAPKAGPARCRDVSRDAEAASQCRAACLPQPQWVAACRLAAAAAVRLHSLSLPAAAHPRFCPGAWTILLATG